MSTAEKLFPRAVSENGMTGHEHKENIMDKLESADSSTVIMIFQILTAVKILIVAPFGVIVR
jgi:hypothetical protein